MRPRKAHTCGGGALKRAFAGDSRAGLPRCPVKGDIAARAMDAVDWNGAVANKHRRFRMHELAGSDGGYSANSAP